VGAFLLTRSLIEKISSPGDHTLGWAIRSPLRWNSDAAVPGAEKIAVVWVWWGDEHDAPFDALLDWPYRNGIFVAGLCAVIAWCVVALLHYRRAVGPLLGTVTTSSVVVLLSGLFHAHLLHYYTNYRFDLFFVQLQWFPVVSESIVSPDEIPDSAWQVSRSLFEWSAAAGKSVFAAAIVTLWTALVWCSASKYLRSEKPGPLLTSRS
jgi:hypothetical protein